MRKLLVAAFLFGGLASAQALRDVVPTTDLVFTGSGSPVADYTLEFRIRVDTSKVYQFTSPDLTCRINAGVYQECFSNAESYSNDIQVTNGTDIRVMYIHHSAIRSNTLIVWTGDCSQRIGNSISNIPANVTFTPLVVTGVWTIPNNQQFSFWRIRSTALADDSQCPADRSNTPGDVFDFPFEDVSGSATTYLTSTTGNGGMGYVMSGSATTSTASTTYSPITVITGANPKLVGKPSTSFTLSAANSRQFKWPGTETMNTYAWTQTAGPGTCTMPGANAVTQTLNCNAATGTTDYTIQLQVTDATPTTATTSQHVGIVTVDANDAVVISNADYKNAIADGKPLILYGSPNSPYTWFNATEAANSDLMAYVVANPPPVVTGTGAAPGTLAATGTVSLNVSTGAIVGTGTNFAATDVNQPIEITWDPDGDSSFSGRFVATVASYTNSTHITVNTLGGQEPQGSFPAGLSWSRLAGATAASTTCSLTPTINVGTGQVTGINGAASCSGIEFWLYSPTAFVFNVVLSGGGGSGCAITANVQGPGSTFDVSRYGKLDTTNPWNGIGAGCGSGYTTAPTAQLVPVNGGNLLNGYDGWNTGTQANTYNYYEAGFAAGRLALQTGLASYYTEWHNFCTNAWRWGFDSGYKTFFVNRNAGWDMMVACATDPSWTPPGGRNSIFAGLQRGIVNDALFTTFFNPSTPITVGEIDAREQSYATRATAKLCRLGGSYGLSQTTWCGVYLAAQQTYIWNVDLINPTYMGAPDTNSLFAPEDLLRFVGGWAYPAAGNPPGSNKFGSSPWRAAGLPAIALADAYDAFLNYGDTTNAALALTQVTGLAQYILDYGTSPGGGFFYDAGYASAYLSSDLLANSNTSGTFYPYAYITVNNGSANVTASTAMVHFNRLVSPGDTITIHGSNYTVLTRPDDSHITISPAFSGGNSTTETNYGNTCAITVTTGSAAVTGSAACKFTNFFSGGNAYVSIISNGCSTGGTCPLVDSRVYAIDITDDTHATLVDRLTSTNVNFVGLSGTYTSFMYAPQNGTKCGTSRTPYCFSGSRAIASDPCYVLSWLYSQGGSTTWKDRATACYNKNLGGQSLGGQWYGTPTGIGAVYSRPGTVSVTNGSATVTGIGTCFKTCSPAQFHVGDQILVGDNTDGGTWTYPPSFEGAVYTLSTILTVDSDIQLTLNAAYTGPSSGSSTGIYYNPADPQWAGADGGYGILSSTLPFCSTNPNPCGTAFDLVGKWGKSLGMVSGAGNAPMGVGILGVTASGNIFNMKLSGISWK